MRLLCNFMSCSNNQLLKGALRRLRLNGHCFGIWVYVNSGGRFRGQNGFLQILSSFGAIQGRNGQFQSHMDSATTSLLLSEGKAVSHTKHKIDFRGESLLPSQRLMNSVRQQLLLQSSDAIVGGGKLCRQSLYLDFGGKNAIAHLAIRLKTRVG